MKEFFKAVLEIFGACMILTGIATWAILLLAYFYGTIKVTTGL